MDQAFHDIAMRFQAMMAFRPSMPSQQGQHQATSSIVDADAAQDQAQYNQLLTLSLHPQRFEDPQLLDEAFSAIDLDRLQIAADEALEQDSSLGYQDHLIKSLLKWFKEDFFSWINAPPCSTCGSETEACGTTMATSIELQDSASTVELYRCKRDSTHLERFPRYRSLKKLLTWRKGRCGEFADCFTLLCRALGVRARWVYNYEDHVWTEIYSTHLHRWIHCDACENAWDAPQMYAVGWGKKMSHCIAFSIDGARDVSRRYIRQQEHKLPAKVKPEVLARALRDITSRCRQALPPDEQDEYRLQDAAEDLELESYMQVIEPTKSQEQVPRESGDAQWKEERGESGKQK